MYATRKSEWIRLIHGDAPIVESQIAAESARHGIASVFVMPIGDARVSKHFTQSIVQVNPASIQRRTMLSFHSLLVARH
jgi:hypothetical protein